MTLRLDFIGNGNHLNLIKTCIETSQFDMLVYGGKRYNPTFVITFTAMGCDPGGVVNSYE